MKDINTVIRSITADYGDNTTAVRKDYQGLADQYGLTTDELDAVMEELMADYKDGDLTGPIIRVDEREADGTPWTVIIYPDGETYNALH